MTFARLAYRPGSVEELRCLLRYLRKEELKRQFAANTSSLILRALWPQLNRALYSDFAEELDGTKQQDTRTGQQIIDDLIERLTDRKERRAAHGSVYTRGEDRT